ncbi:MAG: DUF3152 domain-containing protein [Acidimicrobiales bacterium]
MRSQSTPLSLLVGTLLVLAACADSRGPDRVRPASRAAVSTSATMAEPAEPAVIEIPIALDRRTADDATDGFEAFVQQVLLDSRGWEQAGFHFTASADAAYTVVLAERDEVDALCAPYDVAGRFSCQIGPIVVLNGDRWRTATETWPASLDDYRTMLVNHEIGHLIGRHHPAEKCEAPGAPAAVMAQQSGGLDGCAPNPWPLPWEITCATRHDEPIAPGYEEDPLSTCGPEDA